MNKDKLKYRIWFIEMEYFAECDCVIDMNGHVFCTSEHVEYEDITDKVVVEQCTGMSDINGQLIYEGDIVQCYDITGIVKFGTYSKNDMGGENALLGFFIEWSKGWWRQDFAYWATAGIETIGNIHQTKKNNENFNNFVANQIINKREPKK